LYKPHRGTRPALFKYLNDTFGHQFIAPVRVRSQGYPLVEHITLSDFISGIRNAKFVFSPAGNGIDCHRTWESLIFGAIPIVQSSPINELFAELPVLIVRDWRVVTEESLTKMLYKITSHKRYRWEKLSAWYWLFLVR
jgi:hypothetical protein